MLTICIVEKQNNLNLPFKVLYKSDCTLSFQQPPYWTNSFTSTTNQLWDYRQSEGGFFTRKIKGLHKISGFNTLFVSWREPLRSWWKPWIFTILKTADSYKMLHIILRAALFLEATYRPLGLEDFWFFKICTSVFLSHITLLSSCTIMWSSFFRFLLLSFYSYHFFNFQMSFLIPLSIFIFESSVSLKHNLREREKLL